MSGWNSTRRNRNIGTSRAGHGLENRLTIPEAASNPRIYWEKLERPVRVQAKGFQVWVEPTTPGSAHAVTVDDVVRMFGLLPSEDRARIAMIVLRQPTRKQRVLASVWGRLAYFAHVGETRGPAIILEAQPVTGSFDMSASLPPDETAELERLREDGHSLTRIGNHWRVDTTLDSVRNTQLYRTLLHELGHQVHYDRAVRLAAGEDVSLRARLEEEYFRMPLRQREDFAHRYAREQYELLRGARRVPFPRLVDDAAMKQAGLEAEWFGL